MSQENNEWVIEGDKIQVGNSFKTLSDLKLEFIFEIGLACLLVVIAVFMSTIQMLFTIVCLVIAIVFALIAVGTNSAFQALTDATKHLQKVEKKKEKKNSKSVDGLKSIIGKAKSVIPAKKEKELLTSINAKLVKTTAANKQKVISELKVGDVLELNNSILSFNNSEIGEVNAKTKNKLEEFSKNEKIAKVENIKTNDKEKLEVEIKIEIMK